MTLPRGFKKIVEGNTVALATSTPYGNPHVIAVASVKLREGKLVVTDNYMKTTPANLLKNPFVSLAVWTKSGTGYSIKGTAEYDASGEWLDFARKLKENKRFPCKGVIVVTPTAIKKLC